MPSKIPSRAELDDQLISFAAGGDEKNLRAALAQRAEPKGLYSHPKNSQALRLAARNGHASCVKMLMDACEPSVSGSALILASIFGHAQCVKILLAIADPRAGSSHPLRQAASAGHAECVEVLLPLSDPLAQDESGMDAARHARDHGHVDVAAMIDSFVESNLLRAEIPHHPPPAKSKISL